MILGQTGDIAKHAAAKGVSSGGELSTPLLAVIDDTADIRDALTELLVAFGYRVAPYESGRTALEEMDRGRRPDLIILDLMMPDMDGWTFRIEQRQRPYIRDIPVIAISADASAKAAAIDADAYLRKPIDVPRLKAVVEQVLAAHARKQLMLKGVEAERLRSLGMLVASVAHEINNPLTAVAGYLDVCSRFCERARATPQLESMLADQLISSLDSARAGTERIASIVRLLLTFARGDHPDAPKIADPLRSLDAAISLAQPELRRKARIVREVELLPNVAVSEARLAQVFLNLLVNAAHAIPLGQADSSRVEVRGREQGDMVIFEISDTGRGIAPELLDRIFEPFFSTKPLGHGTGLGLSISRDILREAGGSIRVESKLGHGTTFVLEVPIAGSRSESQGRCGAPDLASALPGQPLYKILVVDDEALVGQMLTAMLDRHEVRCFVDAERALDALEHQHFDAVLCDFFMPKMTGEAFHRELCARRPELASRFILMTGAAPSEALDAFCARLPEPALRKPFRAEELEEQLMRVVNRSNGASARAS